MTQDELLTLDWRASEARWVRQFMDAMTRGDDEAAAEALDSAALADLMAGLAEDAAAA